ncbi:MAG: glycosyl transferase family protein [Hyphomicrobiales bacterium]|nr:glycosyl transferase family protein [Hyphomicrobiales bacterium]
MREPHPFSQFIKILGRGKSLSRSLTAAEAEEAMHMIVTGQALPEQTGAFLMLLRMKEETGEEIAGFARACRRVMDRPGTLPKADIDWSSYAGKKRQLPWFLLSALVLAKNGWRVMMHGVEEHTPGRVYTREAVQHLGLPVASSLAEAGKHLDANRFAFISLQDFCPPAMDLMRLRAVFGLRSAVHTFTRMLNPFDAPCMLQGVFHPGYMEIHRDAAIELGQQHMVVFRGEGGEIERRPNKPCSVVAVHSGAAEEERWPAMLPEPRTQQESDMNLERLAAVWSGEIEDGYATAAITGTLAIALKALGEASTIEAAQARANSMWAARDRAQLLAAA